MRVLFVYPNLYTQMGFNHGLASLSACLRRAGHAPRLVNLNENLPPVPTDDEVWATVREWGPGLIGFSCLTQQYPEALRLARDLRARAAREGVALPPLVVGGIHPTMVPADVMADGAWDYVGVGECEDALVALAAAVERGGRPDDLPNFLAWRGGARPDGADAGGVPGDAWVHNPVGPFPDLEGLPMPDYALFDTARITANKRGWFGLMTSRGCPYRCTYCLNHEVVDRYRAERGLPTKDLGFFRFRRPDQMVDEIRHVLETYPDVATFILDDDLFTLDTGHALAFCEAYRAAGFGVPFVVNSHVKRLEPRVAEALAGAGCRILKLGIESGSERVRAKVLDRHMRDEDMFATIATAESHGLHTSGFVMVGLPGETRAERFETVEFLAHSGLGRFRVSRFFPFPGTRSYDLAVEGGYVDPARMATLTDFTESSCLDLGPDENRLVDQLATAMPWFVNARLDGPVAARYRPLVERVLAMDDAQWAAFRPTVRERDAELSRAAAAAGERHYAVRYQASMGVRSDWFLAEEAGDVHSDGAAAQGAAVEWDTAAARPVPERRRALRAAADEVS